jgi:hypothetical protein
MPNDGDEYKIKKGPRLGKLKDAVFDPFGRAKFTFIKDGGEISILVIITNVNSFEDLHSRNKWILLAETDDPRLIGESFVKASLTISYEVSSKKGLMRIKKIKKSS